MSFHTPSDTQSVIVVELWQILVLGYPTLPDLVPDLCPDFCRICCPNLYFHLPRDSPYTKIWSFQDFCKNHSKITNNMNITKKIFLQRNIIWKKVTKMFFYKNLHISTKIDRFYANFSKVTYFLKILKTLKK